MADGRIKDLNREILDFSNGDYIVVDGDIGVSKMAKDSLLKVTAQNALAGNVAPAFDPTRTSEKPYKAGESVVYEGKTYAFKVDHYGAWSAADVVQVYINNCGEIDNGGIGNSANTYKVKTRVLPFDINRPLVVKITKPLQAVGNYYKIGYQLVTDAGIIGRYATQGSYTVNKLVLAENGIKSETQLTLVNESKLCKGIAFEILEYDSSDNQVANRAADFIGYSVELIQPFDSYQVFYNGGIGNSANAYKVHTKVVPISGGLLYALDFNKNPKSLGNYFKFGYLLTSNVDDLGKDAAVVFSGGSYIKKVDAGVTSGLKISELLDLANIGNAVGIGFEVYELDSENQPVSNRFNDLYGFSLSAIPHIKDDFPRKWGSIPPGGTLAYLTGANGGHLKWSYRIQLSNPGVMCLGTAMATFTNASSDEFKHIDFIQTPATRNFPFKLETDGTRHRIVNASSVSLEISSIFCAGYWQYADNWNAPENWNSLSAVEEGRINNTLAPSRAPDQTIDYSLLNAIARINHTSNGSKDFCSIIVTDSHNDDTSVSRAVSYAEESGAVSSVIHGGDYVGSYVTYGQASTNWATAVNGSSKPVFFVQGNHEKGTFFNIKMTPSDETLYNLFVKPSVDKGYLSVGEYEQNKCYYYHDFSALKTRLIVLDEYRAPTDYDETYWEAITYDSTLSDVANNTDYAIGDKVNVPGFTANSFQAVQAVNTGTYYSGKQPCYKCRRGYRYIDQTEAQWFLDTLYSTPSDYVVVVAMHNPFSDLAAPDKTKKFCQKVNIADNITGENWAQNYMATDFVADALNAFKTGVSYSATISTKSNTEASYIADYSVAKDFSARGEGKFGLIIGGHVHRDVVWKHPTYTYMYQVTPMCSITTSRDNNWAADIRLQNDRSFEKYIDSLTAFAVADGRVALAKLGCKYTTDALVRDIEIL